MATHRSPIRRGLRRISLLAALWLLGVCIQTVLRAQETAPGMVTTPSTNATAATPDEQKAALRLQITNAWLQVIRIVNQPVVAYARTANLNIGNFGPGWFHPGAIRPDFNTVDVRESRDLRYSKYAYVSSDLNPTVCFQGRDLEFNPMTKLFYVNRSLPKKRLTEAEMLEINRLYRIIGHGETELAALEPPPQVDDQAANAANESDVETVTNQPLANLRRIPQQTRIRYGGIAIGVLAVLMVAVRLFKKNAE